MLPFRLVLTEGWITRSNGIITIVGDVLKIMIVLKGVSGAGHLVLSRLLLWRHCGGTEKPRSHNLSRGREKVKSEQRTLTTNDVFVISVRFAARVQLGMSFYIYMEWFV